MPRGRLENGPDTGVIREEPPTRRDIRGWSKRFRARQEEFEQPQNHFVLTFLTPALINLMSDLHIGHATTDYKRIEDELTIIGRTANSFVIFMGDLIDNLWWNPGQMEQMEQAPEQIGFIREIFEFLAGKGKLLHAIQGDHDGWLTRAGFNLQREVERLGATTSNGPTYMHMRVGTQDYDMGLAHALPGSSIYNPLHPQMRSVRFGSMHGADVVASGHNHKKGVAVTFQHELGVPKPTTYIALGPYKATDSWLLKKGWPAQKTAEMFGTAVYLSAVRHEVEADMDIIGANRRMR